MPGSFFVCIELDSFYIENFKNAKVILAKLTIVSYNKI